MLRRSADDRHRLRGVPAGASSGSTKALGPQTAVTNPGLTDLPQASVEAHVAVDHQAYPSNPSDAQRWSGRMRRVLGNSAPGDMVAAGAAEPLERAAVNPPPTRRSFSSCSGCGVLVAGCPALRQRPR